MKSRRAFVFSLDSFVAFTLTVAAIYTLVFFSTVPSAYYSSLMQANFLAKDTLLSLATTSYDGGQTYLDYIVGSLPADPQPARLYIGALIPDQFGYKLESWNNNTGSWDVLYDTATDGSEENTHNRNYYKLKAASQSVYLILNPARNPGESPYGYITCSGNYTVCDLPPYDHGMIGSASLQLVRFTVYA